MATTNEISPTASAATTQGNATTAGTGLTTAAVASTSDVEVVAPDSTTSPTPTSALTTSSTSVTAETSQTGTSVPPPEPSSPSSDSFQATSDTTAQSPTESSETVDAGSALARPTRVLLYHFSTLEIATVPQQLSLLTEKLGDWGYDVDTSADPAVFSDQNLTNYAAVGMINTCFNPFGANNDGETEGFVLQRFLQAGGGLFGIHCADVTFQSANPPALYNQLLGGRASSSNFEGTSQCRKMASHPTTDGLPDMFTYVGNLDGTNFLAEDTEVLVNCTWDDGNGEDVAVSWVRNEGQGRVFFSNFAKVDSDFTHATIGDPHLFAGLSWVLGL